MKALLFASLLLVQDEPQLEPILISPSERMAIIRTMEGQAEQIRVLQKALHDAKEKSGCV